MQHRDQMHYNQDTFLFCIILSYTAVGFFSLKKLLSLFLHIFDFGHKRVFPDLYAHFWGEIVIKPHF